MTESEDGTFLAEWGRVGTKSSTTTYPASKWNSVYKQKLRKGYKDITEYSVVEDNKIDFEDLSDPTIQKFINQLQGFTKQVVRKNYNVSAESVTEAQISEAQDILDSMVKADEWIALDEMNERLIKLYSVIPRKMNKVTNYLIPESVLLKKGGKTDGITFNKTGLDAFYKLIGRQQDILDSMGAQVQIIASSKDQENVGKTLLQAMNLEVSPITDDDRKIILNKLAKETSARFHQGFRVTNLITQKRFDSNKNKIKNKTTDLLWHGSRNENWWSILGTGLLLRPTNVVVTGKMFGYGLYFADRAKKSIGYTSLDGSYWAGGTAASGYLGLFDVHIGKILETEDNIKFYDMTEDRLRKIYSGYHSLFAKKSRWLYNNEVIIYNQNQCTIKYIVELK